MVSTFTENQSYSLLFDVLVVIALVGVFAFFWRYLKKRVYMWSGLPLVAVCLLFITEKLETNINEKGITFEMFPIEQSTTQIEWHDIEHLELHNHIVYNRRISSSFKYDVYSIFDECGLYIYLKNGKKYIIGTKKPDELRDIVTTFAVQNRIRVSKQNS